MPFKTDQEAFWRGDFGNEYSTRNQGAGLLVSNKALFARALRSTVGVKSILELGCNVGLNLAALHEISPTFDLCGYEINASAVAKARELSVAKIVEGTIIEKITSPTCDLTFTKGVLIHINPDYLDAVYQNLYDLSNRYVMICEYYNPSPVTVNYRGNQDRLFKRDFAGEMIARHGLKLVDYGFVYHGDKFFPQDDMTWFLMEK